MHLSDPAHSSVHMVIDAPTVVRNIAMLEKYCLIKGLIHHAAAAGMSALDALMSSSPADRQVYPSGSLRVWLQRRAGVLWPRFEEHHSESAAATGRRSFGPVSKSITQRVRQRRAGDPLALVSNIMQDVSAKMGESAACTG